jgi:diaminopimelate epimerase
MQGLRFRKMHGLGNDFVVVDARHGPVALSPDQVVRIADRHRGVGFDQLVLIERSPTADAKLVFRNADGSEAGACGNGSRCAAALLLDESDAMELRLETAGGMLEARRRPDGLVTVAMPAPRFAWQEIPLSHACDTMALPIVIPGLGRPTAVNLGNPHAVFFVGDLAGLDVPALGPELERHPLFPDRANIGFAQPCGPDRLRLKVFERGAGLTLACGSGACAAMVAAFRHGLVGSVAEVILDGGALEIAWSGSGPVLMTGPTALSFTGMIAPELLDA